MLKRFMKAIRCLKSTTIMGRKYKVKTGKNFYNNKGEQLSGFANITDKTITLDIDMGDDDFLDIQLHEVAHCILYTTGLEQVLTPMEIEAICQSFGSGFGDHFRSIIKSMK